MNNDILIAEEGKKARIMYDIPLKRGWFKSQGMPYRNCVRP